MKMTRIQFDAFTVYSQLRCEGLSYEGAIAAMLPMFEAPTMAWLIKKVGKTS